MRSISIEQELVEVAGHNIRPSAEWANFTATFGRREIDAQTLGSIAGNLVVRAMGREDEAAFRESVAGFVDRARPLIYHDQKFMRAAYETASIEDTLSRPRLESAA